MTSVLSLLPAYPLDPECFGKPGDPCNASLRCKMAGPAKASLSLSVAQSKSTSETTRQQPFQLINELKLNRPKISYSVQ